LEVLLALDRSRKTHEEEEKKRRAGAARQGLARGQPVEAEHSRGVQSDVVQNKAPETAPGPTTRAHNQGCGPQSPQVAESNFKATKQDKAATDMPATVHTASQETDYGDFELDSIDFEELGLGPF
jgi:hypothetical protein